MLIQNCSLTSIVVSLALLLGACSTNSDPDKKAPVTAVGYWTLDFFYFYNSKQTHHESFQFEARRDCFEAMYQMQIQARTKAKHSGSGVCTKWFAEGQARTQNDVLGYR